MMMTQVRDDLHACRRCPVARRRISGGSHAFVRFACLAGRGPAQPHRGVADVHLQRRGRNAGRLASRALGQQGRRWRGAGIDRGHGRVAGRAHLAGGYGAVERCAGRGVGAHRRVHRGAGRRSWRAARARGAQGIDRRAMAGRQAARHGCGRLAAACAERIAVRRGPSAAARDGRSRHHRRDRGVPRRGGTRSRRRLPRRRSACRPRLPVARVPVAADEPARGQPGRRCGRPRASRARGRACGARGVARAFAPVRARVGDGLGRRGLGRGCLRPARAVAARGRRRLDRLFQWRSGAACTDSAGARLPGAVRGAHPSRGRNRDRCRRPDHRCASGRCGDRERRGRSRAACA